MTDQANKFPISLLWMVFSLTALEFLQSGMVAFASGHIVHGLNASFEQITFSTATYYSLAIVSIATQRWMVERVGWRRLVLSSIGIYIVGCVICAAASGFSQFLGGRLLMALGGGGFMTAGRVLVSLMPPSPLRFVGVKHFAHGLSLGFAVAPGLTTLIVNYGSWRLVFLFLAGLSLLIGIFASAILPTHRVPSESRSTINLALISSLCLGSWLVLLSLQRAQFENSRLSTFAIFLLGLLVLALAYRLNKRSDKPLLNLHALNIPSYLIGVSLFGLCYVIMGATSCILYVVLEQELGLDWSATGKVLTIGYLAAPIVWFVMAWVMPRTTGTKKFFILGFLGFSLFGWLFWRSSGRMSAISDVLPALGLYSFFLILVMGTTAFHTFREVQQDPTVFANAQQLKNMVALFGMSLGTTAASLWLQWRTASLLPGDTNWSSGLPYSLHDSMSGNLVASHLSDVLPQASLEYLLLVMVLGVLFSLLMSLQKVVR